MKKYMITYQTANSQPGAGQAQTRIIECEALTSQVISDFISGKVTGVKAHSSLNIAIIFIYPLED